MLPWLDYYTNYIVTQERTKTARVTKTKKKKSEKDDNEKYRNKLNKAAVPLCCSDTVWALHSSGLPVNNITVYENKI